MKKILILLLILTSCKKDNEKTDIIINPKIEDSIVVTEVEKPIEATYSFDKNFVLGKFDYRTDSTFVKAEPIHSAKTLYVKKEVYKAFVEMYNSAKKDGVDFKIISGTRNFYEQKAIWERKWKKYSRLNLKDRALKILEYSSMPSTSRHHWGTDLDLNNLNNSYFNKGKGYKEYTWLKDNASKFGFFQVYTNKQNGRTGYNEEKWHWTYLPLSKTYLKFYNETIAITDVTEFKGSELAKDLNVISDFVNGVNKEIKTIE